MESKILNSDSEQDKLIQIENIESDAHEKAEEFSSIDVVPDRDTNSFSHELKMHYRYIRKQVRLFIRRCLKKHFVDILYITPDLPPDEYIIALQKQYPDKIIQVLKPLFPNAKNTKDKPFIKFDYSLQNKKYLAEVYKYNLSMTNIQVYAVYTDAFEKVETSEQIYNIKYLSHYAKCARIVVQKLKPDIIHSENIPFYLGMECNIKNVNTPNVLQVFHHLPFYNEIEPFWAALNLLDNHNLKKLCKDKIIKKNLAALFGVKSFKNSSKLDSCLEYLYENFEKYRNTFCLEEKTNENFLIAKLNERVLEIFPHLSSRVEFLYRPELYSIQCASLVVINSKSKQESGWLETLPFHMIYLKQKESVFSNDSIYYPFDLSNFRDYKKENKKYLIKEFSKRVIETKFTNVTLFKEEVNTEGFLDIFYYNGALLYIPLANMNETDIKTVILSVLKCFELRKNIQVIFNLPHNFNSPYLNSVIEFLKSQHSLDGKWIKIEGKIKLEQFLAASDMILLPSSNVIDIENILYKSLKYGCIPVVTNDGICGEIVTDIFDDMTVGCGFKNDENNDFDATLKKALNFYVQNLSGWNLLIKNSLQYDRGWNFDDIEKYNNLYDEIL